MAKRPLSKENEKGTLLLWLEPWIICCISFRAHRKPTTRDFNQEQVIGPPLCQVTQIAFI